MQKSGSVETENLLPQHRVGDLYKFNQLVQPCPKQAGLVLGGEFLEKAR